MLININKNMRALVLAMGLFALSAQANEGGYEKPHNEVSNVASLQRGARNFVNYCSGCHSLKYVRYNRLAVDLQLSEAQVQDNLIFNGSKLTSTMTVAMNEADAAKWFGKAPPDLSLIARARGTDYLYSFLKSFYVDASRPTGMNNTVLASAAMPNVLWELQGIQQAVYEGETTAEGNVEKHFKGFEITTAGTLKPEEFDEFVRDTVNFLDYVGEPGQLQRKALGFKVLGFLLVLFLLVSALKKEYWKDIK